MSYCAPGKGDGKTCYSYNQLKTMANALNAGLSPSQRIKTTLPKIELWSKIREQLSNECSTEYCWIDQAIIKNTRDTNLLMNTFRPKRPMGKYQWLTTSNIHDVMKQYEQLYPDFVFFGPVPMDFAESVPEVANVNVKRLYKQGIRKLGFVFNTDPSDKPGKHWISMFVNLDRSNPYIGFFDSFAICPPPPAVQRLINYIKGFSEALYNIPNAFKIECNMIRHQRSNSECGVYSIYFITESLKGKTFQQISGNIVLDEQMNQHRSEYFRPQTPD